MDIIQAFIEKHNGIYIQEDIKSAHTPFGKYTSHPKSGKTLYKGNKIKVYINEVGGVNRFSELFRMKLYLDKAYNIDLLVFPRSYWKRRISKFLYRKDSSKLNQVKMQYKFSGSKKLISNLLSNKAFVNNLIDEFDCINYSKKDPKTIIITPSHGYRSVEHLEKLAETLTIVKSVIKDI